MLRFIQRNLSVILLAAGLFACGGDDGDGNTPAAVTAPAATPDRLSFANGADAAVITVKAAGEWDAYTSDSWITLKKQGTIERQGTVEVAVAENTSRSPRTGKVEIISGRYSTVVTVEQEANPAEPVDPTIDVPDGYELVWHDEFDGDALDTKAWRHEVQGPGWVNNELQTYVNGSFDGQRVTEVADGQLTIRAFALAGKVYSGRIYALEHEGWKYGIIEARIRLPKGRGTWPAFWMMPVDNNFANNPWPRCGEIDIMEEVGYNPCYTSSSVHTERYNHVMGTQRTAERFTDGAQDDFHVYRLEWTADAINTYVDGHKLLTFTNDGSGNVATWPFNKPFYVILNLAWGGDWGGAQGVDPSCLPAEMTVDYVRVFQPK